MKGSCTVQKDQSEWFALDYQLESNLTLVGLDWLLSPFSHLRWHNCVALQYLANHRVLYNHLLNRIKGHISKAAMPANPFIIYTVVSFYFRISTCLDMELTAYGNDRNWMFDRCFCLATVVDARTEKWIIRRQNYLKSILSELAHTQSSLTLSRFSRASGTYNVSCRIRFTSSPFAVWVVIWQFPMPIDCIVSPFLQLKSKHYISSRSQILRNRCRNGMRHQNQDTSPETRHGQLTLQQLQRELPGHCADSDMTKATHRSWTAGKILLPVQTKMVKYYHRSGAICLHWYDCHVQHLQLVLHTVRWLQ